MISHSGKVWQFQLNYKDAATIQSAIALLRNCTQRNGNLCSHKNQYTIVHRSFTHNRSKKKQETAQCRSRDEWLNKLPVVHPPRGIWLGNEKELLIQDTCPAWISRELRWVKKANLIKLHTIWYHLYDILETAKL